MEHYDHRGVANVSCFFLRTIPSKSPTVCYLTSCKLISCIPQNPGDARMRDESTKQAAQEFLATKLAEEGKKHDDKLNRETAVARSLYVWKVLRDLIFAKCKEWNNITQEETL